MILDDVAMLAANTIRTKCYLEELVEAGLLPAQVIYLQKPSSADGLCPECATKDPVQEILEHLKLPYRHLITTDVNSPGVVDAVRACRQSILIYSGPPGAILRKALLGTGKRFLHIHPGCLPDFRGSTTIYYSLLAEGCCGATALLLDSSIDTGPVIRMRKFPPPPDRTLIDTYYDSHVRAQLLIEVLQDYGRTGQMPTVPQKQGVGETYFIIHPVLKHIAILSPSSKLTGHSEGS